MRVLVDKRINIISDSDGGQIVVITDICFKGKHNVDAKYGWYRFTTRFALPVYESNTGEFERFNVFRIEMLIRHASWIFNDKLSPIRYNTKQSICFAHYGMRGRFFNGCECDQ